MHEHDIAHQWLQRCAQRLQRHRMTPAEATELASELLASTGLGRCPERIADDLLRMPAEA
jgi:hypothetical protein